MFSLRVARHVQEGLTFLALRLDVKHFKDEGILVFGQRRGNRGAEEQAGSIEALRRSAGAVRRVLPAGPAVQPVGEVFIFSAQGGVRLFIKGGAPVFQGAGVLFFLSPSVDQPLAFHMPHDESCAQNDKQDDFSRIGPLHGGSSDDGDNDNQNGLEQVCFLEEGGLLGHKKDAGEKLVELEMMLYKSC